MVCPGYFAAWMTDLHGFRRRSLVERLFWSVPLSLALSTITSVLVARVASFTVAAALVLLSVIGCIIVLALEFLRLRRSAQTWHIGLRPYGPTLLLLALFFVAFQILSLVDFQSGQRLHMSLTFYDVAPRTNWANSVLRTGIPPANPHYFYLHPASFRYYYFWLADCAVVAKISRLPMRSIVNAGCIWSGFCLTALTGLYLKHFLAVGTRLRRQLLIAALLPAVGGFSLCIFFWNMLVLHAAPPGDVWVPGQITDLINFFLFYPHHLLGMCCCMFAFLLGWMPASSTRARLTAIVFIGLALASSFGISIYTTFAFFLVMLCWAVWQIAIQREPRAPLLLFAGGALSLILLLPYLREITHSDSKMSGGSPFALSIRETIPPDRLAHLFSAAHPSLALAKLLLLLPGSALELGFYCLVLLIFLIPSWRGRQPLSPAHRTLLFLALAALPVTSFIRSAVIEVNDFGIHSALFLQYPLLLLASELLIAIRLQRTTSGAPVSLSGLSLPPRSVRTLITLALLIGILGSTWRAAVLRFILPIATLAGGASNPHVAALPHEAYIAYLGYADLNRRIPPSAIVQFNPEDDWLFWKNIDLANINRQTAIASAGIYGCGSSLGGDPSGCPIMSAAIVPLFHHATAPQARSACHQWHINYLVANVSDPAWHDPNSWVWTLNPILANPEFRALDCQ